MKALDLRKKNPTELQKLLSEQEAEVRSIRFGAVSGTKNVKMVRSLKKDIARIKTILHTN
jgi:ribosomal protein L29